MSLIVLFDIDGTLLTSGGAGRRAIQGGLRQVVGRPVTPGFSFAGMTDRAIMRRALSQANLKVDETHIDAALEAYLKLLPREVDNADGYRVFDGVRTVLDELVGQSHIAVGLGTGNARRGAAIKLRRGGLDRYFQFGGFGCEYEDRAELIGRGIERGAQRLGDERSNCRVVVVGDTPADIEAARKNNAECLVVTTGSWSREKLEDYQPEWLVDALDPGVVRQLLR